MEDNKPPIEAEYTGNPPTGLPQPGEASPGDRLINDPHAYFAERRRVRGEEARALIEGEIEHALHDWREQRRAKVRSWLGCLVPGLRKPTDGQ